MINSRLLKFIEIANELLIQGKDVNFIIKHLRTEGATLAITIKTLVKIGYNLEDVDDIISKSKVWKDSNRFFEDLFLISLN